MKTPITKQRYSFTVRSYEAGTHGRATLQTMSNYLQEVAGLHARQLGFSIEQLAAHNQTWVLRRLGIQMATYPKWGDTVWVETWPSGMDRLFALREFRILDKNGAEMGRGSSQWLLIQIENRRPVRPTLFSNFDFTNLEQGLVDLSGSLKGPASSSLEKQFEVRRSDLDQNHHLNNTRYIAWATETVPASLWENHRIKQLDILFKAEGLYGEAILSQSHVGPEDRIVHHRLMRATDQAVLAFAQTKWE